MSATPDPASPWVKDRCDEYTALEALLREAQTINHGSGALERIQRVIGIADKLTETDMPNCRPSFMRFLKDQILASRFPTPTPKKNPKTEV